MTRNIVAERRRGRGMQYKVRWDGYGDTDMEWLSGTALRDTEVLDVWERRKASRSAPHTTAAVDDAPTAAVFVTSDEPVSYPAFSYPPSHNGFYLTLLD